MRIERNLGADVIMQFDHVVPGQSQCRRGPRRVRAQHPVAGRGAAMRSVACAPINRALQQALFPIVQGGIHADLRRESAARTITGLGRWAGYGIGGLSRG